MVKVINDNSPKCSYIDKKIISNRINKLHKIENKTDLINIYSIIKEDIIQNSTSNSDGIWFDFMDVQNKNILLVEQYLNNINVVQSESDISNIRYSNDEFKDFENIGPKLSNHEKSLIKKIRISEYA
jgi:hypothetical protein